MRGTEFDPFRALEQLGAARLADIPNVVPVVATSAVGDEAYPFISPQVPSVYDALNDPYAYRTREIMLQKDQLTEGVMRWIHGWLQIHNEKLLVLANEFSLRDPEAKKTFLQAKKEYICDVLDIESTPEHDPLPLRSVTLNFGEVPVLVSSATNGSFLDNLRKAQIGADFGLTAKKSKSSTINDKRFDAGNFLGLTPGTVCPFIPDGLGLQLRGFYYIPQALPDTAPVEIAVSPLESLIMKRGPFERMLGDFMNRTPQDLTGRPYQRNFKILAAA